ncbi:MAG TPA: hypothetical protein V6D07_18860 [Trichocoleus sp.]
MTTTAPKTLHPQKRVASPNQVIHHEVMHFHAQIANLEVITAEILAAAGEVLLFKVREQGLEVADIDAYFRKLFSENSHSPLAPEIADLGWYLHYARCLSVESLVTNGPRFTLAQVEEEPAAQFTEPNPFSSQAVPLRQPPPQQVAKPAGIAVTQQATPQVYRQQPEPEPEEIIDPYESRKGELLAHLGRNKESGVQAIAALTNLSRPLCLLGSSGIDTHPLLLMILAKLIHENTHLLVFDSLGKRYLGLERSEKVVRQVDLNEPFWALLDTLYEAHSLVHSRIKDRQHNARNDRANPRIPYELCCLLPLWSYWAGEWVKAGEGKRKTVIKHWALARRIDLDLWVIDPLAWMRNIAVLGPEVGVKLILTVSVDDLRAAKLTQDQLANFSIVGVGQVLQSGPSFDAIGYLIRGLDNPQTQKGLEIDLAIANEWSKQSHLPVLMLEHQGKASLYPTPPFRGNADDWQLSSVPAYLKSVEQAKLSAA